RVVPVIYAEVTPSERLGKLEIRFSPARIEQRVRMMILRAVLRSALVLAAISAALILIARQITRPLAKARDAIARIQQGDYHTAPIGTQRNDEIGEVMRAIDGFRLNAIEMEDLRRLNDRAARDERRRIRAALESTQDAAMIIRETGQVVFQNAPARIMLADLFTNLGPDLSLVENPADRQSIQSAILERKGLELNATVMIRLGPTSAKRKATPVRLRINPIYDSEESYLGVVILATDITDQVRAQSHINHLANHDSLTGLANRRVLEESLDAGLEDPDETDVALLLLDLDRFKIINDTLGHPVGDELLITVGNLLGTLCESGGIAARLGGDEFSMLFRGRSGIEAARRSASAIVEALSQTITVGDKTLRTGASIGIAHLRPGTDTASDGLRKADLALYEAKRRGRGRSVEFQQDLEHEIKRKTLLEKELRSALVNREIEAYFQRQVSLSTEELAGFEALARWHHADLGAISPEEFIAVAEETNQIAELTHQMLTQACRMAASWHKTGFRGRVSVNISP
ncbi:MAG: diguanylate cyclase, partial [Pseudomonadota bacterium]